MPVAYAVAALPRTLHYLVWCTSFHIPYKSLLHLVGQYLSEHYPIGLAICTLTLVIHVSCYFHSCITYRIEWQNGNVKIDERRIISVNGIKSAVIEIRHIILCRQTCPILPAPLTMDSSIIPGSIRKVMILGIEFLRIKTFPPLIRTIGIRFVSVLLRKPPIIFHASLLALEVKATAWLIPRPGMICME